MSLYTMESISSFPVDPTECHALSYSLLQLPPRRELRKKGYNVEEICTNSSREHPLAKWTTHALRRGATYRDALDAVEDANKKAWGLIKARITFSNGSFEAYVRTNANDPLTLRHAGTYDPNGVFRGETASASAAGRALLLPRLRQIADARGHHTQRAPPHKTFAPQTLYRSCPPPVHTQAGYDFTPMSHHAFLLRAGDRPVGARDVQSDFVKSCTDYRPRSYLREVTAGGVQSRHGHCAEVFQVGDYTMDLARATDPVNHRNRVVQRSFTKTGTRNPHSTIVGKRHAKAPAFPCTHQPGQTATRTAEAETAPEALNTPEETPNGERETGGQGMTAESDATKERSVHFAEPSKETVTA